MEDKLIDLILKLNKKYFFKKEHPFNISKNGVLNINYSDFEYSHTESLLNMYSKVIDLDVLRNKSILEIGCGGGGKSVYIAEKFGSNIVGLDINDNFLYQAYNFAKEKGVGDLVKFYNRSALQTGFEDNSFDVIVMSDVIEHIPNTEDLFDEMWRILKKDGIILFDFAPYYHYFGHHLWDTIQIPWLHVFFTDKFLIKLYKKSVENLVDKKERIGLRIGSKNNKDEVFDYLNKIKRKDFEKIVKLFLEKNNIENYNIKYYMLKYLNIFSRIPLFRELFIKHIVGFIKK